MKKLKCFWLGWIYFKLYLCAAVVVGVIWGTPDDVAANNEKIQKMRPKQWRRLQAIKRLASRYAACKAAKEPKA